MKRKKQKTADVLPMSVGSHISELRNRLLWVAIIFLIGGIAGYVFQEPIIKFINGYIQGSLYYTSPSGNFNFIMKISALVGIVAAVPVFAYQMIKYIQPAVKDGKRYKRVWLVSLLAFMLAMAGINFALWVVLPLALHFFAGFSVNGVKPLLTANEYLTFIINILICFVILFQLPLLVLFINRLTPLSPKRLLKYERHVIVLAMVVALLLPFTYDPVTQITVAMPVIVLYNLSILLVILVNRSRRKATPRPSYKVVPSTTSQPAQPAIISQRPFLQPPPARDIKVTQTADSASSNLKHSNRSTHATRNGRTTAHKVGMISDFGPSKRSVRVNPSVNNVKQVQSARQPIMGSSTKLQPKPSSGSGKVTLDGIILPA